MPKQLTLFSKLKMFKAKSFNPQNQNDSSTQPNKKTKKRKQGDYAEALACDFLSKNNMILVDKNFTTRAGEIDLIMKDKTDPLMLVFIEVRYRKNNDFGGAAASVTPQKQKRIIKAALAYHQQHAPQSSMRFDVIAIEGDNANKTDLNNLDIHWIKSAFDGF